VLAGVTTRHRKTSKFADEVLGSQPTVAAGKPSRVYALCCVGVERSRFTLPWVLKDPGSVNELSVSLRVFAPSFTVNAVTVLISSAMFRSQWTILFTVNGTGEPWRSPRTTEWSLAGC
jgi:hypothetical protein